MVLRGGRGTNLHCRPHHPLAKSPDSQVGQRNGVSLNRHAHKHTHTHTLTLACAIRQTHIHCLHMYTCISKAWTPFDDFAIEEHSWRSAASLPP